MRVTGLTCRSVVSSALLMLLLRPGMAGDDAPRTDRLGDPLPQFALARLGTQRLWHASQPRAIAFSPDGKTLATAAGDVRLWDVVSGKELRRLKGPGASLKALDFTADGKTLIGAGLFTQAFYLVDVQSGKLQHCIGERPRGREMIVIRDSNMVRPFSLFPDGKLLAVPFSQEKMEIIPEGGVRYSPPQQWIRCYDSSTGKQLSELKLESTWNSPQFIALTPDSKALACLGEDHVIHVRDRASGKSLARIPAREHEALCGAFSGDGKTLATGGMDKHVRLWDTARGTRMRELNRHEWPVRSVAYHPDGKSLVSASPDRVCLWEMASGKLIRELMAPADFMQATVLSPQGTHVAGLCWSGAIVVWELATGKLVHGLEGHRAEVRALGFSRDGKVLVSGGDDAVLLWDAAAWKPLRKLDPDSLSANRLALLADASTLVVGDSRHPPELWDLSSGKRIRRFKGPGRSNGMRLSPDGKVLVTLAWKRHGSEEDVPLVYLWDVKKGECTGSLPREDRKEDSEGQCIAFSPDGKLLATSGKSIKLWSVPDWKVVRTIDESAYGLAFSPDSKLLARTFFDQIVLHDVASGREVAKFGERAHGGIGCEWPLVFSSDGRTLAIGGMDGLVRLYEVATGGERRRFSGHRAYVRALAFAPDGKTLVSGSEDTTAIVWDLAGSPARSLTRTEAWTVLAEVDAGAACDGLCVLAITPKETVGFLKERLPALRPVPEERLNTLIVDLNSNRFAVREKAMTEMELHQELAIPALKHALKGTPDLELRLRLERLLARVTPGTLAAGSERLRWLRALELLERIGTPDAVALLTSLAGGSDEVQLVREARSTLRRLKARP